MLALFVKFLFCFGHWFTNNLVLIYSNLLGKEKVEFIAEYDTLPGNILKIDKCFHCLQQFNLILVYQLGKEKV